MMSIVISQKRAKRTVIGRNQTNEEEKKLPPSISQRYRYVILVFTCWLSHLWRTVCVFATCVLRKRKVSATAAIKIETKTEHRDIGNQHLRVVGLDCEMVGVGCKGRDNMLARCTMVLWDPHGTSSPSQSHPDIKVIYDKLVKPTRRVTDYRTEYSGITREMLQEQQPSQPLVDFQTCRGEVRSLLSSMDGKNVLLVGHALINDFKALQLTHPSTLIRDTATYPPFLIRGHTFRRHRQQKLSFLVKQELGIVIQQGTTSSSIDCSARGHCSIEDASAALLLYLKHQCAWETYLGRPLLRYDPTYHLKARSSNDSSQPSLSVFLDGCNLPISLQGAAAADSWTGSISWRIISRTKVQRQNTEIITEHDWIPTFRAWLSSSPTVPMDRFVVMFDGSKYKNSTKIGVGSTTMLAGEYVNIELQITDVNQSADDSLVDTCRNLHKQHNINTNVTTSTSISDVLQLFLNYIDGINDDKGNIRGKFYVVVRRRGGCRNRQTKQLFQKLNLTRSNGSEGVFCLTHLTQSLLMDSVRIAKEIQRLNCSTLQFEIRDMTHVRMVVCTNDILLAERVVQEGGITLTYRQFQHLKTITSY